MKTFFISENGSCVFDEDNKRITSLKPEREGISRIFLLDEDCTIVYENIDGKQTTLNAKAGQILIKFWTLSNSMDPEHKYLPIALVDSEMWKTNILQYREYEQKQKEEWALKQKENENSKEINSDACEPCC